MLKREGLKRGLAACLLLCVLAAGCGTRTAVYPLDERIGNVGEIVSGIRRGLREHARSVTITFDYGSDIYEELNGVIEAWVEAALAETDSGVEGDYLRYQYGGYAWSSEYSVAGGRWRYTVEIVPDYYTYLFQEEAVTEKVGAILREFSFGQDDSDYERLKTVYDYLCRTVTYDKIHRKNPYSHLKSTAYAALIRNTATCQGYCVALYRLLRESGVECRIVTGTAEGEKGLHAWVIARLDGQYYNLDPTWDAGQDCYQYFLAGSEDFTDHVPAPQFLTEEFTQRYPISETSYGA